MGTRQYRVHVHPDGRWMVVRIGANGGRTRIVVYGTTPEDFDAARALMEMLSDQAWREQ